MAREVQPPQPTQHVSYDYLCTSMNVQYEASIKVIERKQWGDMWYWEGLRDDHFLKYYKKFSYSILWHLDFVFQISLDNIWKFAC